MELQKRRGCIRVSKELLEEAHIDFLKLFFSNFYPINIETIEFDNKIYYGYSEHFDISIEGELNQYIATIDSIKKTIEFSKE